MPSTRPNIILIITDEQRYDTINALGFPYMDTPHLDRLVREGVSFSNCYVTAPSCAPSRASLFGGCYPHKTGVLRNGEVWPYCFVEDLAAAGYHCVNVGKMHTIPYHAPSGFHERYVVENKDRYLAHRYYFDEWDRFLRARGLVKQQRELYRQWPEYPNALGAFEWRLPEESHPDFFVGDFATWWLDHYPVTKPLFLQIGFPGPHPPYDPVPRYVEPYLKKELPMPVFSDEEIASQPAVYHQIREHNTQVDHDSLLHKLDPTAEEMHRQRAHYFANMTMIDEKIGQIMEALERRGYLENSVIIFTSDHGDALCDHGHSEKWTMYDIITRMPCIVWAPGRFQGGRVIDDLIQQFDLAPAILELAEATPSRQMQAQSVLPVLEGKPWKGRDVVFSEHARDTVLQSTDCMTMLRTKKWKLVHFVDSDQGQLFDMENDPQEMANLWAKPQFAQIRQELIFEMLNWRTSSACFQPTPSEPWLDKEGGAEAK